MIDSHCHLDDARFVAKGSTAASDGLTAVLARARKVGVQHFIIAGVHPRQWHDQQDIQQQHEGVFNAFGVHPWFSDAYDDEDMLRLKALLPKAVAIGECGLDFTPSRPDKALQVQCFQRHIGLAVETKLPLILHQVKASDAMLGMLKEYPMLRGVVHGFSGSLEQAEDFVRLGFCIGIGSRLLNPQARKLQRLAQFLPLDAILLESDAPHGLPKAERNEPAIIRKVAHCLATLRNQDENTIVTRCRKNTEELFHL